MTQKISIVILACVVILVSAVLSGCGSSSPTNSNSSIFTVTQNTGGGGNFGSVTVTGSTSATVVPLIYSSGAISATSTVYTWTQVGATSSYSITCMVDNASKVVTAVAGTFSFFNGGIVTGSNYMAIKATGIPATNVNTITKTITFTNVVIPGTAPTSASNTVTYNGTLKYQ